MWGGVGPGGFAPVLWHSERKTDNVEWSAAVRDGLLTKALRAVNPGKTSGPWVVLCDNESFLEHETSKRAYRKPRISLLHIPAKSPDLNPVEKFWGWARKKIHKKDLAEGRQGGSRQDGIQRASATLALLKLSSCRYTGGGGGKCTSKKPES